MHELEYFNALLQFNLEEKLPLFLSTKNLNNENIIPLIMFKK